MARWASQSPPRLFLRLNLSRLRSMAHPNRAISLAPATKRRGAHPHLPRFPRLKCPFHAPFHFVVFHCSTHPFRPTHLPSCRLQLA
jgi:hypothetical protein